MLTFTQTLVTRPTIIAAVALAAVASVVHAAYTPAFQAIRDRAV